MSYISGKETHNNYNKKTIEAIQKYFTKIEEKKLENCPKGPHSRKCHLWDVHSLILFP